MQIQSRDELWDRLARLGTACELRVFSTRVDAEHFWTVVVRAKGDARHWFEVTAGSMYEAVTTALTTAAARGLVRDTAEGNES